MKLFLTPTTESTISIKNAYHYYNTSKNVTGFPTTTTTTAAIIYQSIKPELESLAFNVIDSSDRLVTQLGNN